MLLIDLKIYKLNQYVLLTLIIIYIMEMQDMVYKIRLLYN